MYVKQENAVFCILGRYKESKSIENKESKSIENKESKSIENKFV